MLVFEREHTRICTAHGALGHSAHVLWVFCIIRRSLIDIHFGGFVPNDSWSDHGGIT